MTLKKKDIQNIGIQFGERWKLVPLDDRNWELCHKHETGDTYTARSNGSVGEVKWHRLGKYYQHDTFGSALRFAADRELKESHAEVAADIMAALTEYERILQGFLEGLSDKRDTAN